MVTVTGKSAVKAYMAALPAKLERDVLRGAARAGAKPIAEEVKLRSKSNEVRDGVITKTKYEPGEIRVFITLRPGWPLSLGIWEEYGTDAHFIRVDDSQRQGMSAERINRIDAQARKAGKIGDGQSLVIAGNFVGSTVWHPGATPHPIFRPALDTKEAEAVAAAQSYINSRISGGKIVGSSAERDDQE